MVRPYQYKTTPYKHQQQALKKLLKSGWGGALLMDPRTGKTKTVIDYLSILASAGKIDRAVIVAPTRVLDVWVEEFAVHCPVRYQIVVWDKDGRKHPPPTPHRAHQLTVLLVNYEAFGTPGRKLASGKRSKKTGRFAHRDAIRKWIGDKPAAGVLDESHKIKSPSGRAASLIVSMRPLFNYRVIMTGTPVTKATRIFDIYMQWKFLNPDRFREWSTSEAFKNEFGQWTNRNGYPQFLKPRNMDVLQERLHMDSFRVTRDECFDLPEKTTRLMNVKLGDVTGKAYDTLAEEMVTRIEHEDREHIVEATIPLTLALRLTQITGGFATTVDKDVVPLGGEKLQVLDGILEEQMENDEKVVVCARFRAEMDAITALCMKRGIPVYEVRGGLSRAEVTANIADFKNTGGVAACVMNPQAGGVGIDLSTAAHMVWYSLTPSWVQYTQACDRIALSKKATTYTYLLADHTVDRVLYDTLTTDGDVAEVILRNPRKVLRNG